MKAMTLRSPAGLDMLQSEDRADPGVPGAGMIRVALHGSSLNYHDLGVVTGRMPTEDGRIPLSDGAGVVESIGDGVTEFAVGDLVAYARPPATLPGGFEIAARKTYGHVSDGMICSGSKAVAATGTISWMRSDDRFKSCSSERGGRSPRSRTSTPSWACTRPHACWT